MKELLLVCAGGAVGSGARHLIAGVITRFSIARGSEGFPWGTLTVNVLGSFLLGVLLAWGMRTGEGVSPTLRVLLGTGALGGFTTYSTFNYETLSLVQHGQVGTVGAYVGVTLVVCLLAGAAGVGVARALSG